MISIAIDGPAGAGKSTIAKQLAKKLGFIYVDTGALYRAIGLYAKLNKIPYNEIPLYFTDIHVILNYVNNEQKIYLNEQDISEKIRSPEIAMAASKVSAIPAVRDFLLSLQRQIAIKQNVIMDGRDIGTVVLPSADLKIFLTASVDERAHRRYFQHQEKNISVSLEELKQEIEARDEADSQRTVAPLKQAKDAILIDNTDFSLEQTVDLILNIIKEKLNIS